MSDLEPVSENDASVVLHHVSAKSSSDPLKELESDELLSLKNELATARKIQGKLLPQRLPQVPGFDFDAYYAPASELAGDFYDFIPIDKNRLGIVVADASGKGLSGSLLMVEARAVLRSMAFVAPSPKDVLRRANRVLVQDLERGMFITMVYALLDTVKGTLTLASAGHTPLLLWRKETKKCYAVNPSGLVLGAATEEMFDQTIEEKTVELRRGDRFVLYTDGVTELMDCHEQEFGNTGLVRCTYKHAALRSCEYVQALVQDLEHHRSGYSQSDDITIVSGRMVPEEEWLKITDNGSPPASPKNRL